MTDIEILKKAIEKARGNGYKANIESFEVVPYDGSLERYSIRFYFDDDGTLEQYSHDDFRVIFSHDFAKAFWGEEEIDDITWDWPQTAWEYRLKQMVISEDPIKYLEQFIAE